MISWIQARLKAIPVRCTPLIGMDLNDKLGSVDNTHDEIVGPFHPGKQLEAANLVRNLFKINHLSFINTFWSTGDTFYGPSGHKSRIDFTGAPLEFRALVKRCHIWYKAGKKLQIITDTRIRDHAPVIIEFKIDKTACQHPANKAQDTWDADALSRCLQDGQGRKEFLDDLQKRSEEEQEERDKAKEEPATDRHWSIIVKAIQETGSKHFSSIVKKDPIYEAQRKKLVEK